MRFILPLLVTAITLVSSPSYAGSGEKALRAIPRSIQISVGRDHIWGSVRATRIPSEVGKTDWAEWDRDKSGMLEGSELRAAAAWLGAREVVHTSISLDGIVLPFPKFGPKYLGDESVPLALDAALSVRIEGRTKVDLAPGMHHYVLYDVPPDPNGFVPIRFSTVKGFAIRDAQGTRGEKRNDRRLEVTTTAFTPAMWGTVERLTPGVAP